ncbi:ABC transporter permease [Streptomyces sp. DH20]|uniref:ABC transporter permease n=1 Tax=Streptomyces sp. DH20 TaxID=2857009 RepID=UPI001E4238D2|nr:ABC transporter permease [Streptomyces sp. DH20]
MTSMAYALTDAWTMTRRELARWGRQPAPVVVNLVFPVMLLLMFGYLIGGGRGVNGDYLDYLLPGMLALSMAFGLEGTMIAVTQDMNKGVVDRFRSMPMADGAVLVGRAAADMLQSVLALVVLLGVATALGWRTHAGPAAFLGAVGLLLLLRFAMLWVGIHLALVAGKPEMVQAVQILVWPFGFLSTVFATPESMPGWLAMVVQWNPISHTAAAVRDLFGAPGAESGHVGAAVLWPLALLAVFFPLAVRRFARLSR